MCGLVGIQHFHGTVDRPALQRATDALSHRGPDGEGHWISPDRRVALGHRRLAIIDPLHGAQPMEDASGRVIAVVNGEFYDEPRIRRALQQQGHVFRTGSDSEILLHLYLVYGADCLANLRGEFAFILYDKEQRRLIAARDRFGIKPLCYGVSNGALYLASEAKALFAAGVPAAWNHEAVAQTSCFQYSAPHQTMFKDVHQLPPGHLLMADAEGYRTHRYWDMDFPEIGGTDEAASFEAQEEQLGTLLRESIGVRLRTDGPRVCCHVSGGVDSASILGIASHLSGAPLPCFTVAFDHEAYDESPIAEAFARSLGSEFHRVSAGAGEMIEVLSDAVYFSEGLAINNHLAAKFLLNRAIWAAGFTIALSGEGSDELFAGYPHFKLDQDASSNKITAENLVSTGVQLASGEPTLPVDVFRERLGYVPNFVQAKAGIGLRLRAWMHPDFVEEYPAESIYRKVVSDLPVEEQLQGRERIHQSTYLWCKYTLANYILRTLGDGCEMAHAIEGRVPFLDHVLFDFARTVPNARKIHDGIEKYILRKAVAPYVSPEINHRRKHPFMAPPLGLLSDRRGIEYMNDHLRSLAFRHLPFFDADKVVQELDRLPQKNTTEHIAAEPGLMLMLTSHLLAQRYRL